MITCTRCGNAAAPPSLARIAWLGSAKARVAEGICGACWSAWEDVEVKVINEYRLNFMDPEHRDMLRRACLDFLKLEGGAPAALPPEASE